ncbi:MAG: class II fumarate hydratase [Bacteroidales bacterium]|nr:class II fumarate hydratase [Bacteroidales bacterium]
MENYRIEKDSLGEVPVPEDKLWGAQTERARTHFKIGKEPMPLEIIRAIAMVKRAAACSNCACGQLSVEKRDLIVECCDAILSGQYDDQFPLHVWQTGSGTQSNMNVNEVISNWAEIKKHGTIGSGRRFVHPNDDVNKSQSTNDVMPSAIRIAVTQMVCFELLPALQSLRDGLAGKSAEFSTIVKIGRTHLMDATPLTLGQEFSGYVAQVEHDMEAIKSVLPHVMELPVGGTAVGTGLNTPDGYIQRTVDGLNQFTGLAFSAASNKFEAMASHDSLVELSGMLKRTAVSLMKIANDLRLLGSGPRSGLGELVLPANEPGSSIMPGKVNPTQCEAVTQVCCQVIGNDAAITAGAMQGHLELNVFMPMIGNALVQSIRLLSHVTDSFNHNCIAGLQPNEKRIHDNLHGSLMLVTALNVHIGYEKAAQIAQYAYQSGLSLRDAAVQSGMVSAEDYDAWVVPEKMV